MPVKKPAKKPVRKPAKKMPPPRVAILAEDKLMPAQRALLDSIRSGPRGGSTTIRGPFAVFLHAPAFGELAQQLGGHCRFKTAVAPRLSEFAILATAKLWRAQYEWFAHAPMAERAGVKAETIRDLHKGRVPKSAPKDERAIYDFVQELYKTRRVSDKTYARVRDLLGEPATVEFVGILGYYVLISMILNVFRMSPPEGEPLPFAET
ncbi:MAG: carboxymuconolactone decarboxylase family protein [Hyphomicrobiales bacterium]|nr:carboxymuconolactone decarboxylase family protein [Hyphomicrobiales bacterium]